LTTSLHASYEANNNSIVEGWPIPLWQMFPADQGSMVDVDTVKIDTEVGHTHVQLD